MRFRLKIVHIILIPHGGNVYDLGIEYYYSGPRIPLFIGKVSRFVDEFRDSLYLNFFHYQN